VANGGIWQPPRLIKRMYLIGEHDRERDLPLPPTPDSRRVFSPDVAAALQHAMTTTLTEGTGKSAALDGYTAAGKTGTAEKVINGRYSGSHNIGSFVCWAPAEPQQRAELLCLVVIDDPSVGKGFGSLVAAPVVQKVLQQSLEYLRIPKNPALEKVESTTTKTAKKTR
jgi:cell division protein FtsI/penicillin-binding protein 2